MTKSAAKKQARQKKMAAVEAGLKAQAKAKASGPRQLVLTPQISIAIQGSFPDQYMTVEEPAPAGRKKTVLTQDNIYSTLFTILQAKAGEIELERQLANEQKTKAGRKRAQPDWRLIAKHPEATIIERLAPTVCQTGSGPIGLKAEKTLEEMGL